MLEQTEIYQAGFFLCVLCSVYAALQPSVLLASLCVAIGFVCYKVLRRKFTKKLSPEGRSVLVTGCDTGIGFGLANRLNEEGFRVIATCLNDDGKGARDLKKVRDRMHVLELDVTSDESVAQCVAKVTTICKQTGGGLWGLVNNAGIVSFGDVELTTMQIYKRILDVNLLGVVRVTKAFLPLIRKVKGRVVSVTSVKGICAYAFTSAYNMSKFGVEALTDTLRLELKRFGVKAIAVEPGNFGGTTGLWHEENMARMEREITEMTSAASEDVLTTYGEGRLKHMLDVFDDGGAGSHPNLDPVLDDLVDALINERPAYRYTSHGGRTFLDIDVMLSTWRNYLPVTVHDYLMMRYRGLPPQKKP